MLTLFIIRHAKASPKDLPIIDYDRPLYGRGISDAMKAGAQLADRPGIKNALWLSSPASRALSTARLMANAMQKDPASIVTNEKIYEARYSDLLDILKKVPQGHPTVLLFGHNPSLSDLAEFLCSDAAPELPTCGILELTFNLSKWSELKKGSGKTGIYLSPKG